LVDFVFAGDKAVETSQGTHLVYVHAGTNPFEVIRQSVKAVERHMQTFHHREKKKVIEHFMALVTTRVQSDFI
jgi:negative regulator of replication initiation